MSAFLDNYLKDMVKKLKRVYPDRTIASLTEEVNGQIQKNFNPKPASLINTYRQTSSDTTIFEIVESILKTKPAITGNGGLFDTKKENLFAQVLQDMINTRGHYKKLMLQYKNTDAALSLKYNGYQSNYKIGTNSVYGLLGLRGSILNDVSIASSVTTTGQTVITNSIIAVESFFGNFIFLDEHHMFTFISTILHEMKGDITRYMTEFEIKRFTPEFIYEYLIGRNDFEISDVGGSRLMKMLKSLNSNELASIFYKNNFFEFIKIKTINKVSLNLLPHNFMNLSSYLSGTAEDETGNAKIEVYWRLIDMFVTYNHLDYNRYYLSNEKLYKKFVHHTDTDSIFVGFDRFVKKFEVYQPSIATMDKFEFRYSTMSIGLYVVNKYIENVLDHLGTTMFLPDQARPNIAMKNEFIMSRIIMTKAKKHYVTNIITQEGVMLKKPDVDIKGLSFKKSTVSPEVKEFITNIVEDDILLPDDISVKDILIKIANFQQDARDKLNNGSLEYASRAKVKSLKEYVTPYQIPAIKASFAWNAVYPNRSIEPGDPIYTYKLDPMRTADQIRNSGIPEDISEKLISAIFNHDIMSGYGFAIIGIPASEALPKWVIPLVDIDTIISDNLKHALPIMESLGLRSISLRNNDYISNIVNF